MSEEKSKKIGMFGKGRESMPNIAFHIMTFIMKITDLVGRHAKKKFKTFKLLSGQIVVDYGCGPARYIKDAAQAVGDNGKVYAVDIHPLAIKKVKEVIKKHGLTNVEAILAKGYSTSIADNIADVIYALDMFHMIENPKEFLYELLRMLKNDGQIILEDGHQSRQETMDKLKKTALPIKISEKETYVICTPVR